MSGVNAVVTDWVQPLYIWKRESGTLRMFGCQVEREAEPRIEQGLIGSEGRILEGLEERKPFLGVLGFSSSRLSLLVHIALVGGGCKCTHFIWG